MKSKEFVMSQVVKAFRDVRSDKTELSDEEVERLLKDIDISSAINKIERATASRLLSVTSKEEGFEKQALEIEKRFSDIKFNRILNHLLEARYFGYSCFEIVYNEDFTFNSLVPVSHKNLYYHNREWKLKIGTKEIKLTREKFLLCIHQWTPHTPQGQSVFESCQTAFLDKERYQRQLRGISEKYGDVMIIYPYDDQMSEEEAKEVGKAIQEAKGKDAIGIPVDRDQSIKDKVEFIKLSDLDPKIYEELQAKEKEKLLQNLLGSTLTMNSESSSGKGTQALGKVHQDGFDEVIQEVCNFCTDSLYQLIQIDSMLHGYDYKAFEWSLDKVLTEEEKREREKEDEQLRATKVDSIVKLNQSGYELEVDYLGEYLGIDSSKILKKKDDSIIEFSESTDKLTQTIETADKFKEYIDKKTEKFTNFISEQIKKQVSEIEPTSSEFRIDLDYSQLEDDFILSQLKGYTNNKAITLGTTVKEFDPFAMKFEDAIKTFNDKTPIDFSKIEEITEEIRAKAFWMKKSTDLEITNRLYKSLSNSLEKGTTFKDWLKGSEDVIAKSGLGKSGYYLENVYRTNMMSSYAMGNYKQQMEVVDYYPYWEYKAIEDERTSSVCQSLDGTIKKHDDAFWSAYYPPNHFNCRSTVISRNRQELKENGLKVSRKKVDVNVGTFKGNPAKTYWGKLEKNVVKKENILKENIKVVKKLNKPKPLEIPKLKEALDEENYKVYVKQIQSSENKNIPKLYEKYSSELGKLKLSKSERGYYSPSRNEIHFDFSNARRLEQGQNKYSTLAHEFGHFFDNNKYFKNLEFKEIDLLNKVITRKEMTWNVFERVPSSCDKFLKALEKDTLSFKDTLKNLVKEIKNAKGSVGVQDALDGMFGTRDDFILPYGHGERYYNAQYNYVKKCNLHKKLKDTYKSLGYDASSLGKTKWICRKYDTASEAWANITSAVTNGGEELEAIKKYLPNMYEAFNEILEEVI